jgi:hypothetical protein
MLPDTLKRLEDARMPAVRAISEARNSQAAWGFPTSVL